MSILVWTLLTLSLFNPLVKKINSLLVFFLKLSLYTFILDILESIHLELLDGISKWHLILRLSVNTKAISVSCGIG